MVSEGFLHDCSSLFGHNIWKVEYVVIEKVIHLMASEEESEGLGDQIHL